MQETHEGGLSVLHDCATRHQHYVMMHHGGLRKDRDSVTQRKLLMNTFSCVNPSERHNELTVGESKSLYSLLSQKLKDGLK